MKKVFIILVGIALALILVSCADSESTETSPEIPPAFSVIQKQLKLTKQTPHGESTAFSKEEFNEFLGEEVSHITVTALPKNGTLVCNGTAVLKGQTIPAEELEYMKFIPNGDIEKADFNFTCDSNGYYGNEIVCDIIYTSGINAPPVANDNCIKTVEGISCETKLDIREPNGDDYTINIITYPADGYITIDSKGSVIYTPESGFHGKDKMIYTVTDRFGEVSGNATLDIEVAENESGIYFADMAENTSHLYAHKMCEDNIMVYRYENGSYYFDPETPVTKMDFLVMMMCASNLDDGITAVADSFVDDDTGLSSGLKGYLSAAFDKGILKLNNGRFSPKEHITVSDAAFMIAAALKLPDSGASFTSSGTADAAYDAVAASVTAGIIDAPDGAVDTGAILTKSDAAKLLCRMKDYIIENNIQNQQ